MGSYHGHCCHWLESLIQSEAAIACLPKLIECLWGKNVLTRLFPNRVMFSALQGGTSCPVSPGRLAHLLWDAMPNLPGTPCPICLGRLAQFAWDALPNLCGTPCPLNPATLAFCIRIFLVQGTFLLAFPVCNGCGNCATDATPGKTLNVDISPSNSIPLLKRENHLSISMPNIFVLKSQKETCPGKGIPAVAPSVVNPSALDSVSGPYLEKFLQTFFHKLLFSPSFSWTSRKKFFRCGCLLPLPFFLLSLFFPFWRSSASLLKVMLNSKLSGAIKLRQPPARKSDKGRGSREQKPHEQPARESGSHH